jgi:ribosomal protein S8E
MGISRDSRHKRSATGAKRAFYRKKRKFELGRQGTLPSPPIPFAFLFPLCAPNLTPALRFVPPSLSFSALPPVCDDVCVISRFHQDWCQANPHRPNPRWQPLVQNPLLTSSKPGRHVSVERVHLRLAFSTCAHSFSLNTYKLHS